MSRVIWLVLDSLGVGAAPDAATWGDEGADTFGHIAAACAGSPRGPLRLPNLSRLGLPQAHAAAHDGQAAAGFVDMPPPEGMWGYACERACGKDTPSGHWESAGVIIAEPFGQFEKAEDSFPPELLQALIEQANLPGVIGNCHASGTEILKRLGEQHLESGCPIVYTSADSVFQIAAHEHRFGLERLYAVCEIARRLLAPFNIARVIARPFVGRAANDFARTGNRHDYSLPPPEPTLLDKVVETGNEVIAIGKISDIFAGRGISRSVHASGHEALFDATLLAMDEARNGSVIATNFVDFDSVYGHRRDVFGYASALEAFDVRLWRLRRRLRRHDLLVLSADHGCDPTFPGSDHTRECIPVLASGPGIAAAAIGRRESFADIGQSMAGHLGLPALAAGRSFLHPTSEISA
ncbi:MAG: phosphopentomutase [Xanthomonadales bacterium]|nr:phosphopentomutase [Xanthomonadales bacterium]